MSKRKRRSFTKEYKAEVVKLIRKSSKSIAAVARDLDLGETAVRRWVETGQDAGDGARNPKKSDGLRVSRERAVEPCCSSTASEMRVGPSEPGCRIRLQTTSSCAG